MQKGFKLEKKKKEFNIKKATETMEFDSKYIYPFNCSPLDIIFGGGILSGKVYEFYGKKGSAKSTLALECVKAFQNYWADKKEPNKVLWIESESSLDRVRAHYMGCNLELIEIGVAETVEEGFEMIDSKLKEYLSDGTKSIVIWDTIAAAPTVKQKESDDMFSGGISEKPRIISNALPRIINLMGSADSTLVLVNQVYNIVGAYVPTIESKGGESIKFFASVRCDLKKKKDIVDTLPNGEERKIGIISELYTEKNKLTLEGQTCLLHVLGESGIYSLATKINHIKQQFKNTENPYISVAGAGWTSITNVPESVFEGGKTKDIKFQSLKDLENNLMVKYPLLDTYLDYAVYKTSSELSPLLKIRIVDKLWALEETLYGERRTSLTDKEKETFLVRKDNKLKLEVPA